MPKKSETDDRKAANLLISFAVPKNKKVTGVSITPAGDILLKDGEGAPILPENLLREVSYDRPKGPKVQSRQRLDGNVGCVGGLRELCSYESVFCIDTNNRMIGGIQVSAACFICCQFNLEGEKFRVECEEKVSVYEFHNVPSNPELLAILKVARDVRRSWEFGEGRRFAFVTDSELGAHDEFNARSRPIYGNYCLPDDFNLLYASTDTGQEVLNRILRFCDRRAGKYLDFLEEGTVKVTSLNILEEDERIRYRYMFQEGLEIVNPLVSEMRIQPGAKVALYGHKAREAGPDK
jgi:hypothetical protein